MTKTPPRHLGTEFLFFSIIFGACTPLLGTSVTTGLVFVLSLILKPVKAFEHDAPTSSLDQLFFERKRKTVLLSDESKFFLENMKMCNRVSRVFPGFYPMTAGIASSTFSQFQHFNVLLETSQLFWNFFVHLRRCNNSSARHILSHHRSWEILAPCYYIQ